MQKEEKNYYLGLDIGTNSIGWAVTDPEYNILKFKGNAMWGIRLLDESKTAEERRIFRSSRRRNERRKFRRKCLVEPELLFAPEITKVDPAFFQRMQESSRYAEDKKGDSKYSLFNDPGFTDYDYHHKYPTIYHLRDELFNSKEPHDVRLVFLAVNHLIKNRGHFLYEDFEFNTDDDSNNFLVIWNKLADYLDERFSTEEGETSFRFDIHLTSGSKTVAEVQDILKDKKINGTKKVSLLKEKLMTEAIRSEGKDTVQILDAVIKLLVGLKAQINNLFKDEYDDKDLKTITFKEKWEENEELYRNLLGDDFELLARAKAVYNHILLAEVRAGEKTLAAAKVKIYNQHKEDLALLKSFVRKYCKDKYKEIFNTNDEKICNYVAYSGYSKSCSEVSSLVKDRSQTKFLSFLRGKLKQDDSQEEKYKAMFSRIADGSFMPKIISKDNALIPMQLNRMELERILDNAASYLPFLNEKDEKGKTVKEKIIAVFDYRIPYYVGPLNKNSDKAWLIRNDQKIYPWNFNEVVDTDKSIDEFPKKMTNKCTYLPLENVLPKSSLLYSAYTVLNELNNLTLNGKRISVSLKQQIYNDLFLKYRKVSQSKLKAYLEKTKGYAKDVEIGGINGDFKCSLKSFIDLQEYSQLNEKEKEEVIKMITIIGDDRKMLKRRLRKCFSEKLDEDEIKKIAKLQYKGWANFSRKFLCEIKSADLPVSAPGNATGEVTEMLHDENIIRALWETQFNLMELLSDKYKCHFKAAIDKENGEQKLLPLKEQIEQLYVSPKIKRPIYQSMLIVEEIVKIMQADPAKIFVEMARGADGSKEKSSRKKTLLDIYKENQRALGKELYDEIEKHHDEDEFRRDALYLYFTQNCKCMYSGEPIDINDIYNKNLYDIDHIFPRSKVKDDSLDNRVLVKKVDNAVKSNIYPIDRKIREKQSGYWLSLKTMGLISNTKYERLMRDTPLSIDELEGFIKRQLVETGQSAKEVTKMLRLKYGDNKIVYVKARLASDFRKMFNFPKCREINDLHHAKDAYLNIVVGNVYRTKITQKFIYDLQNAKSSLNELYKDNVKGAWDKVKSIAIIKKHMKKNNILYTRYSFKQKGGLFKQNILKKGKGQVPIESGLSLSKYGGYDKAASTYFAIAEYANKKNEKIKCIIPIDLYKVKEYEESPSEYVRNYLSNIDQKADLSTVKIIIPCLKYNTLVSVDGFRLHISSKTSGGKSFRYKPAIQLVLEPNDEKYIKLISRFMEKRNEVIKKEELERYDNKLKSEVNLREEYKKRRLSEIAEFCQLPKEKILELNVGLYNKLMNKMSNSLYSVIFSTLGENLAKYQEKFSTLSIVDQCYTLLEVLKIMHANVSLGNLTRIGGGPQSGAVDIGSKINKSKASHSFKIIHQSITGLYEKEIELLNS